MVSKNQIFIEQRPEGDFAIRRPGSDRASAVLPTQEDAIKRAKKLEPSIKPVVQRVRNTKVGARGKWRAS